MNSASDANAGNAALTGEYIQRTRLDEVLDEATQRELVYVIAAAGYGKTWAVNHYLKEQEAAEIQWIQLTELDNVGSHFWTNFTEAISTMNPVLSRKLCELGFPESLAGFRQFAAILKANTKRKHRIFFVLDDFHLIHSRELLVFVERCVHLKIPGACVIIISRKQPDLNIVSLIANDRASTISQEDLKFTENEIAELLELRKIPLPRKDLPKLVEATEGWALAIKLLLLVLCRRPGDVTGALQVMKQNVHKLFETETWSGFPEQVKANLARLSLVSNLPPAALRDIFDIASVAHEMPELASFVSFDEFVGDYRIHPLYLQFLRTKHSMLSEDQKQETYRWAAQWCSENGYYLEAVQYFADSHQFDRIVETLFSYPFKLSLEGSEYLLKVLTGLEPVGDDQIDSGILFLTSYFIPLLLIASGKYEQAGKICWAVVHEWEHVDSPLAIVLVFTAYINLAYLDMYICTTTHKYLGAEYLRKSVEYFRRAPALETGASKAFRNPDVRSYACVVGEGASLAEFGEYLKVSRDSAKHIGETPYQVFAGYDDLVACENAYFRNRQDEARGYALNAVVSARANGQFSIESMAEQYLLRVAIQGGDVSLAKDMVRRLRSHLSNTDFWNRQLYHDLFLGVFYARVGLSDKVPRWLMSGEGDAAAEGVMPVRELVIGVECHVAAGKYERALMLLLNAYPREPQERFIFGELRLSLLTAVARLRTGDEAGAMADLERAFALSFEGVFEMPFVELSREGKVLYGAALEHGELGVPRDWLEKIRRKASIYAKRSAVVGAAFRGDKRTKLNGAALSTREREILDDLYHGLSRDEMAESRYLSVNTVKKVLQSIYDKLGAGSSVDAVRIALERGLIEIVRVEG